MVAWDVCMLVEITYMLKSIEMEEVLTGSNRHKPKREPIKYGLRLLNLDASFLANHIVQTQYLLQILLIYSSPLTFKWQLLEVICHNSISQNSTNSDRKSFHHLALPNQRHPIG